MMGKRNLIAVLLLVLLAMVLVLGFPGVADMDRKTRPATTASHPGELPPAHHDTPAGDAYDRYQQRASVLGPLPASLSGTQVDGRLQVTARGDLLINPAVRQVFDYFLSALGEESLEDIQARLAGHLGEQLPPEAARQAWQLYEQYMALRHAMEQLPEHDGSVESMRAAVLQRHDMQQAYLGTEAADAFYGLDMAYDHYMIERQTLNEDESLTVTEREQRLANLEQTLPAGMRKMLEDTRAPLTLQQRTRALREQGASEAEIRALREQHFGPAAADRFAAMEQQRAEWDQRYDAYRTQRQVLINSGLSHTDQQIALARLQQRLFAEKELARVQALDRINAEEP
tara:strand:+ start:1467 stop:2495 length:1029 start_codon:yes stop_codon:yes gene_type:complete